MTWRQSLTLQAAAKGRGPDCVSLLTHGAKKKEVAAGLGGPVSVSCDVSVDLITFFFLASNRFFQANTKSV